MKPPDCFLITCEHGGNRIPARYRALFDGHEALLASHRGFDPGALAMARDLATALNAPLFQSRTSRLLIDLNRSIGHPKLYSEITRSLPADLRRAIRDRYYLPYRTRVADWIAQRIERGGQVTHIASHSFTPVLGGEVRNADIGLLYDPSRSAERTLCLRWQAALNETAPSLRVRRNYPYAGRSDGLTAWLRRNNPAERYIGIELEINQKWIYAGLRSWRTVRRLLIDAVKAAV
jgi:predicted N-formylglutamate amidohydrolase